MCNRNSIGLYSIYSIALSMSVRGREIIIHMMKTVKRGGRGDVAVYLVI